MRSLSIALAAMFVLAGAGCAAPETLTLTETVHFATPIELALGETIEFEDGLQATLVEINDSRCPADVQCIWAGELGMLFTFVGGNLEVGTEVRLGAESAPTATFDPYTATLVGTTETTATISVTTNKE